VSGPEGDSAAAVISTTKREVAAGQRGSNKDSSVLILPAAAVRLYQSISCRISLSAVV
jgi:hypothetical protein